MHVGGACMASHDILEVRPRRQRWNPDKGQRQPHKYCLASRRDCPFISPLQCKRAFGPRCGKNASIKSGESVYLCSDTNNLAHLEFCMISCADNTIHEATSTARMASHTTDHAHQLQGAASVVILAERIHDSRQEQLGCINCKVATRRARGQRWSLCRKSW